MKNCKVAFSTGLIRAGLAINNDKIVSIAKDVLLPAADKAIDCKGNLVLPGGIDFHVHLMDLGHAYMEDWGGICCRWWNNFCRRPWAYKPALNDMGKLKKNNRDS